MMFGVLAWLAGSKIGRVVLGVAIIAFFYLGSERRTKRHVEK